MLESRKLLQSGGRRERIAILFLSHLNVLDEASIGDSDAAEKRMELLKGIPVLTVDSESYR